MDLDGIRILDLTQLLPGPYGTQLLADMGAEVIKVEPPSGDPARLFQAQPGWAGYVFSAVNNGKKSVSLDLKRGGGAAALYDMVEDADVVVEQFRPGVTKRLEIDYETLHSYNNDLIYCSLTGYGQSGPYEDRAGHDLNYVGFAGLAEMSRQDDDEPPTAPGYPIADMSGGHMAATSILSALLSRELGNAGGQYIDLSMTDTVLSYAQVEVAMADDGLDPRAGDTPISGAFPWYGIYETSDERHVTLAALEPKFWATFCEAIDRPDLVEYHMTEDEEDLAWLREELADVFASKTRSAWEEQLGDVDDAMFGLVNTPAEAVEDPHIEARGLLVDTEQGHRRMRFPAKVSAGEPMADGAEDGVLDANNGDGTPEHGEHTDTVLTECGYDEEEIESLRDDSVI
jgi:alpha-methylacyl-CoA racemase